METEAEQPRETEGCDGKSDGEAHSSPARRSEPSRSYRSVVLVNCWTPRLSQRRSTASSGVTDGHESDALLEGEPVECDRGTDGIDCDVDCGSSAVGTE